MALIYAAFFISGCAGLMYETLWVRLFSLSSGHTVVAVSAVLSAYMGGLALGSRAGGRLADRLKPRQLLPLYVILELLTAATGWATLPVTRLMEPLIAQPQLVTAPPAVQFTAWFLAALAVVIVPAALMGATFPPLTRLLSLKDRSADVALPAGLLYGLNLLGAVLGVAVTSFLLVPLLGLGRSFLTAAATSVTAAALAVVPLSLERYKTAPAQEKATEAAAVLPGTVTFTLIAAGAAAMMAEIAWTRAFASIIGSSTYAFAVMLLTFLAGLALGTLSFRLVRRLAPAGTVSLGALSALLAAALVAYTPIVNRLPFFFLKLYPLTVHGAGVIHGIQFTLCAAAMFVPALLMGLVFPLAVHVLRGTARNAGDIAGTCYSATTLGNIAGSLAAGLLLVPFLGPEKTLMAAAVLYGAAALGIIVFLPGKRLPVRALAAASLSVVLAGGILFRPRWDPHMLASGLFLDAANYRGIRDYAGLRDALRQQQLLFYKDGPSSSVAVLQAPEGIRYVRVNGKTDASTGGDMQTQIMLGCLPALACPAAPRSALLVGLGSGVTAGTLASFPSLDTVDCIEIEPAMIDAARLFSGANRRVLENRKFRVITADARHYLAAAPRKYDLIVSEPSNPWIAGVATLFTREAFALARARLSDRGVFCQWFHSYLMRPADFALVMRTFASVFPHTMLLAGGRGDFLLLGSAQPWNLDYPSIESRIASNPDLQNDLLRLGLNHPFVLLQTSFLLADRDFTAVAGSGPLHRDDRPTLEFTAPYALADGPGDEERIFSWLAAGQKAGLDGLLKRVTLAPETLALLYNRSAGIFLSEKHPGPAARMIGEAMKIQPANTDLWTTRGRIDQFLGHADSAERWFRKAAGAAPGNPDPWFHLGLLYRSRKENDRAVAMLERGLKLAPGDPMANLQAGIIRFEQRRFAEARRFFAAGLPAAANPDVRNTLLYYLGLSSR